MARRKETHNVKQQAVCDEVFDPLQKLAIAVLYRALLDYEMPESNKCSENKARREAKEFFANEEGVLELWCKAAKVDYKRVQRLLHAGLLNHVNLLETCRLPE